MKKIIPEERKIIIDKCRKEFDLLLEACVNITWYRKEQILAKNQAEPMIIMRQFILMRLLQQFRLCEIADSINWKNSNMSLHRTKFYTQMNIDKEYQRKWNKFSEEVDRLHALIKCQNN